MQMLMSLYLVISLVWGDFADKRWVPPSNLRTSFMLSSCNIIHAGISDAVFLERSRIVCSER